MKPIETYYAGCRFRSRLEARWAVFFDELGLKWDYEPQGYMIPIAPGSAEQSGYLPDFWLPDLGIWAEVKGNLDHDSMKRVVMAASAEGLPLTPETDTFGLHNESSPCRDRLLMLGNIPRENDYQWLHSCISVIATDTVAMTGVSFAKKADGEWKLVQLAKYMPLNQFLSDESPDEKMLHILAHGAVHVMVTTFTYVRDAYRAARSARFEHGESGTPR